MKITAYATDSSIIERDILDLIARPIFEPLKTDEKLFKQVRDHDRQADHSTVQRYR